MGAQKRPSHCPINTTKDKKHIMIIGKATKTSHKWVYPFTILIILPAFIFAELSATSSIDDSKISKPSEAETSHQDIEISPLEVHEEPEYGDAQEDDDYAIVENEDGERFLVVHSSEKRAAPMGFANMLRLDKKSAHYNPSFNSMLRLDKKEYYNPSSFNSMLRLDKKAIKNHQGFANMLRLDKRAPFQDNFLRLDKKKFSTLLRLDKKASYNPSSFNSMLRLDKKAPMRNQNFANFLRLDKKAASYSPSFASNMLRLDKKAAYNPSSFNSMLRLDKKYSPNSFNAFSNQLRLDKKSFKSSLRNFGLLRLD